MNWNIMWHTLASSFLEPAARHKSRSEAGNLNMMIGFGFQVYMEVTRLLLKTWGTQKFKVGPTPPRGGGVPTIERILEVTLLKNRHQLRDWQ